MIFVASQWIDPEHISEAWHVIYTCSDSVQVVKNKKTKGTKVWFFCVSCRPVTAESSLLFSWFCHHKNVIHIPFIAPAHMKIRVHFVDVRFPVTCAWEVWNNAALLALCRVVTTLSRLIEKLVSFVDTAQNLIMHPAHISNFQWRWEIHSRVWNALSIK
jgi:hypothetical protein